MTLPHLLADVRRCTVCAPFLPHGPRPVVQAAATARILIAGQAPGRRVHASGVPFDDPSGDRLRAWMGVDRSVFHDPARIAILPMGFCWPGSARSGDLPPRPECAPLWRERLLAELPAIELTLVIGRHAQRWHLAGGPATVTATVARWQEWWPAVMPLPHPSPRNNRWLRTNPWFEEELLPPLRARVAEVLGASG